MYFQGKNEAGRPTVECGEVENGESGESVEAVRRARQSRVLPLVNAALSHSREKS
jgi:hypothetical protein